MKKWKRLFSLVCAFAMIETVTCKVPVKKVCINTFMQTFLLHISHCLHK